jgi:hypothetical protein
VALYSGYIYKGETTLQTYYFFFSFYFFFSINFLYLCKGGEGDKRSAEEQREAPNPVPILQNGKAVFLQIRLFLF